MPGVNSKIFFGVELECTRVSSCMPRVVNQHNWLIRHDGSVRTLQNEDMPDSREIITRPIPVDVEGSQDGACWHLSCSTLAQDIIDLCSCASEVNTTCGVHVHLGRPGKTHSDWGDVNKSDWGPERVRTMLIIGLMLEDRMYDLCHDSRRCSAYCRKIRDIYTNEELGSYYPAGATVPDNKYDCLKRRCWLNIVETRRKGTDSRLLRGLSHGTGTIEIRLLGNTKNPEYIYSWIALWLQIASYVAYLPGSLAVMRAGYSGDLDRLFAAVAHAKELAYRQDYNQNNEDAACAL